MKSGIYKITNTNTNKIYIGSAYDVISRIQRHIRELNKNTHHNKHLQVAWAQDGSAAFSFECLEICSKQQVLSKEKEYLNRYNSYNPDKGYNILNNAHSFHNLKHSEETKRKMSEARSRFYELHPEHKEKLSLARKEEWASGQRVNKTKGRKVSLETKLKQSKYMREHPLILTQEQKERRIANQIATRNINPEKYRKFTVDLINIIRNEYNKLPPGITSQKLLAKKYQCNDRTIRCIVHFEGRFKDKDR